MSYLSRLKNLKGTEAHTTKTTKTLFVVFVAPSPAPFKNSGSVLPDVGKSAAIPANDPTSPKALESQPAPAPEPAYWQALDRAYQAHHTTCLKCIAAGKGYGLRCGTGAALWAAYGAVAKPKAMRAVGAASATRQPATAFHSNLLIEATPTEIDLTAARLALFDARGLRVAEAEALADKLLVRDREGDRRGVCAECRRLTGSGLTKWRCTDTNTAINDLAGANLGAAYVHQSLHRCDRHFFAIESCGQHATCR